jgi:hypothetical protein
MGLGLGLGLGLRGRKNWYVVVVERERVLGEGFCEGFVYERGVESFRCG